jgi:hypothetical protein
LLQLEHLQTGFVRLARELVILRRFRLEVMNRLQRLTHRRRLQHPRSTDKSAPDVRDLGPVGFLLRLDRDPAADDGISASTKVDGAGLLGLMS